MANKGRYVIIVTISVCRILLRCILPAGQMFSRAFLRVEAVSRANRGSPSCILAEPAIEPGYDLRKIKKPSGNAAAFAKPRYLSLELVISPVNEPEGRFAAGQWWTAFYLATPSWWGRNSSENCVTLWRRCERETEREKKVLKNNPKCQAWPTANASPCCLKKIQE